MTNATLTTITVPGSVDAYGDPASNTSAWTGSVKGYLKRPRIERTGSDLEEDRKSDTFVANASSARTLIAAVVGAYNCDELHRHFILPRCDSASTNTNDHGSRLWIRELLGE